MSIVALFIAAESAQWLLNEKTADYNLACAKLQVANERFASVAGGSSLDDFHRLRAASNAVTVAHREMVYAGEAFRKATAPLLALA
jgi:hypothetical protein